MEVEEYVKSTLCTPKEAVSITDVEEALNAAMDDFCTKYEQLTDQDVIGSPAELELRAILGTIIQCIAMKRAMKGGECDAGCDEGYNPVNINGD